MGTGIVSVALASDDRHVLSLALVTIAAVIWAGLGLLVAGRAVADWPALSREARTPAALTAVAATAVLGTRATGIGWSGVAVALLLVATIAWLLLLPLVLGRLPSRAPGVAFMPTVSTQSLAVLAAQLALRTHTPWLFYASLAVLALGLALYVLVLTRFDLHQLVRGRGDHWVSGGALAISALAAARVTLGARGLHLLVPADGALEAVTLALWSSAAIWLSALILTELLRPRLRYDLDRWGTVFPVGMYAACSFDAGRAAGASGLAEFARVWVWLAFTLWVVVFASSLRALWSGRREDDHPLARL